MTPGINLATADDHHPPLFTHYPLPTTHYPAPTTHCPMVLHAEKGVSLKPFTTLRAGGPAEFFSIARTADDLAEWAMRCQEKGTYATYLGWGSNVLPADAGVPGLTVVNDARQIEIKGREVVVDCGCGFQELFLKTVQVGLRGLEYAVGIPGTVGGALVSNAGAYRSNISEAVRAIEIVRDGKREWVEPEVMQFSYRDSLLRRDNPPPVCLIRVRLELESGDPKRAYDEAREYQRQRISKQPPPASAGSFFKNVYDQALADRLDNLPANLRAAGVVPSGYLIEKVGLKGKRHRGAMLSSKHANFMINVGDASATSIRSLAAHAKAKVRDAFGVELEEEVLYLGDWLGFSPEPVQD